MVCNAAEDILLNWFSKTAASCLHGFGIRSWTTILIRKPYEVVDAERYVKHAVIAQLFWRTTACCLNGFGIRSWTTILIRKSYEAVDAECYVKHAVAVLFCGGQRLVALLVLPALVFCSS